MTCAKFFLAIFFLSVHTLSSMQQFQNRRADDSDKCYICLRPSPRGDQPSLKGYFDCPGLVDHGARIHERCGYDRKGSFLLPACPACYAPINTSVACEIIQVVVVAWTFFWIGHLSRHIEDNLWDYC